MRNSRSGAPSKLAPTSSRSLFRFLRVKGTAQSYGGPTLALRRAAGAVRSCTMRGGLHAPGVGTGAAREVVPGAGGPPRRCAFPRRGAGEHVVMFDEQASRYPYSASGQIAVPAEADWLDP